MRLTLIRHGITRGNAQHIYYGATDLPLLPEGEADLRGLAAQGGYPTAPHYFTSPLFRAEQTFSILYGDLPHTQVEGLREMNFGDFEMRTLPDDLAKDSAFLEWCADTTGNRPCPNGESISQMRQRALDALAPIIQTGEDAVCVIHGVVITYLMSHWFPDMIDPSTCTPAPGTGYQIEFNGINPLGYVPVPDGNHMEEKWWA